MANKIPLRLKGVITLSRSENITLCVSTEYNLFSLFVVKGFGDHPKKHLYLQMRCWFFYQINTRKTTMNFIVVFIILMRSSLFVLSILFSQSVFLICQLYAFQVERYMTARFPINQLPAFELIRIYHSNQNAFLQSVFRVE